MTTPSIDWLEDSAWWLIPSCILALELVVELAEISVFRLASGLILKDYVTPLVGRGAATRIAFSLRTNRERKINDMVGRWGQELCLVGVSFVALAATQGSLGANETVLFIVIQVVLYIVTWVASLVCKPLIGKRLIHKIRGALVPLLLGFLAVELALIPFG